MNEPDTYSLFGNIIDNAVEAVKGLSPEKRLISLQIKKTGNLVSVSVKNSYEGNIVFQNGFPVTRKEDKSNHGFGLRSIALVTEKYKGTMTLDAKNGIFAVALLFPQESK
jgi:sensor histidine kinase regulating citrate/malate metabolism